MAHASSVEELRALSKEELISLHDEEAKIEGVGVEYYLDELARRETSELNQQMVLLTKQMRDFTIAVLVLTAINLMIFFVSIIR